MQVYEDEHIPPFYLNSIRLLLTLGLVAWMFFNWRKRKRKIKFGNLFSLKFSSIFCRSFELISLIGQRDINVKRLKRRF